ncbi:uncharacterized protein LOC21399778 [Morus notabilis]|uniref:uncharacterized protein LOC21399778 n=1 Tax=Morus notabilis TaxID=981085 RepID=UPI000CECF32B|nr:uncharacterized protein LOC21399778 [Morus notabilis]
MGRQVMSKRMRVYSQETNKLLHLAFARNYINHLVPALKKKKMTINDEGSASSSNATSRNGKDGNAEREKIVRFEVDMAMALSAKEFAWSRALEANLRKEHETLRTNGGVTQKPSFHDQTSSFILTIESRPIFEERKGETLTLSPHNPTYDNVVKIMPLETSQNPRICDVKIMKKSSGTKSRRSGSIKGHDKKSEEDVINDKLANLRTVLPGGNEMGDHDELLTELASYITCLKSQVQVLQCLVESQ